MERIATVQRTKAILNAYGLQLKKSLGQHFMSDPRILQKMLEAVPFQPGDGALEIGPGIGALTQYLSDRAEQVVAVEIDQRLIPVLRDLFKDVQNVSVINEDFLATDLTQLKENHFSSVGRIHVVANLPYYITTPILMKILESDFPWQTITIMIQKEVADRLAATPGGKEYGSLTVSAQFYAEIEPVCYVPGSAFVPPPNVESAVIRLTKREHPPVPVEDPRKFFLLVRTAFAHRRKTLLNNIQVAKQQLGLGTLDRDAIVQWIESCGVNPSARAETLAFELFAKMASKLS